MNEKADITIFQNESGRHVAEPDPLVLKQDVNKVRIQNRSRSVVWVNLENAPVEEDDLEIDPQATRSVTLKKAARAGEYVYGGFSHKEGSPKIILEGSPKIIVESSPTLQT